MKIAVAGTGYVGLSIATLLAQSHTVVAVDIIPEKVELINNRKSPIQDEYIEKYLAEKELDLTATLDAEAAYRDADIVVIAAPTNYDSAKNFFDTSAVESVIELVIKYNPNAIMVIKSTIPVGYTESVRAMIASTDYSYPNYIHENSGSNTVETDDTGSWIFLWVAYAVFILLPPIPVIAVGAILPHIKKIGKPKYWFILMAFAILWLVAAILLGVLMAVMTSMLI